MRTISALLWWLPWGIINLLVATLTVFDIISFINIMVACYCFYNFYINIKERNCNTL